MIKHATVEDFKTWETKAKGMSGDQLAYAIADCIDTAKVQPDNEGYYHDEASVYRMEWRKRVARKQPRNRTAQV